METLSFRILEQLVSPGVFHRGADYHEAGRVYDLRREGNWVTGSVLGQERYSTRLQLTAPYGSSCTCPYEDTCKHVVALGLAWLERERKQAAGSTSPSQSAPSLHDLVATLSEEQLLSLVGELLDTVDAAKPVVQGFLVRHTVDSYGHRPGDAATEAALIGQQVREWLSQLPPDQEDDEYAEEPTLDDWGDDPSSDLTNQIQTLVDLLCEPRNVDSLPFSVLALSGVAVEISQFLEGADNTTLEHCLDQVAERLSELVADSRSPLEVVAAAVDQVLAAALEAGLLTPALERFVLQAAAVHRELALPLIDRLTQVPYESAISMVARLRAQHQGPRSALASLKQIGGSVSAYLQIARYCAEQGEHDALREACAEAVALPPLSAQAQTRRTAASILLEAELRPEGLALLLEVFKSEPSHWSCCQVLNAATPDERGGLAQLMLAALDREPDLELGLELYLATGDAKAAADLLARTAWPSPGRKARVAAALASHDLDRAVVLWWEAAGATIQYQNRGAYAQAAEWLAAMRSALMAAGRSTEWFSRRNQLLGQYPRHRALHDEMQQAGAW